MKTKCAFIKKIMHIKYNRQGLNDIKTFNHRTCFVNRSKSVFFNRRAEHMSTTRESQVCHDNFNSHVR